MIGQLDKDKLEAIVDQYGLYHVVVALSEICAKKEEHLMSNWQDESSARIWHRAMLLLDSTACKECIRVLD